MIKSSHRLRNHSLCFAIAVCGAALFSIDAFAPDGFTPEEQRAQVRGVWRRDLPEILQLEHTLGKNAMREDDLVQHLSKDNGVGFVVVFDHKIVGYVLYELYPDRWDLKRMVISPEYAGRGLSDQLLDHVINKVNSPQPPAPDTPLRQVVRASLPLYLAEPLQALSRQKFLPHDTGTDEVGFQYDARQHVATPESQLEAQSFYDRLRVSENASSETIARALQWRLKANPDPKSQSLLRQAALTLLDEEKRKLYDEKQPRFPTLKSVRPGVPGPQREDLLQPDFRSKNLYAVLGVPENASNAVLDEAFRHLTSSSLNWKEEDEVRKAYAVLRRPYVRKSYDAIITGKLKSISLDEFLSKAPDTPPLPQELGQANPLAMNVYDRLGVGQYDTQEDIRQAFFAVFNTARNEKEQQRYMQAYKILRDPLLRAYYDEFWPARTPEERRRLIQDMWQNEEVYRQAAKDLPLSLHPDSDDIDQPISDEKALQLMAGGSKGAASEVSDVFNELYKSLELPRTATADQIQKQLAKMRKLHAHRDSLLAHIEAAAEILLHPQTRQRYDQLLDRLTETPLKDRNSQVATFVADALVELHLRDPQLKLLHFSEIAVHTKNANLVNMFLDRLKELATRENLAALSKFDMEELLEMRNIADQMDPKVNSALRNKELQIRSDIVKTLASLHAQDPEVLDSLLKSYLKNHPPDYLSAELRSARDKLRPPPRMQTYLPGCQFERLADPDRG